MDISVLVGDGQLLLAEALASALRQFPDFKVFPEHHTTGRETVEAVVRLRPDVVLLDYWMPGMDGPAATRAIHAWAPATKVLMLSWFHGPRQVQEALAAGAVGFLPKSLTLQQVVLSIHRAIAGDPLVYADRLADMVDVISDRYEEALERWQRLMKLTPREVEILQVLCQGRPAKQAAKELRITVGTLKNHVHNILQKTGAATQLQAINMARHEGLIREMGPPTPEFSPHDGATA